MHNLHPGANCAYEHSFTWVFVLSTDSESLSGSSDMDMPCLGGYDTIRRSSSIGSEVISDDDYSNMPVIDQKSSPKRKYTAQRRRHASHGGDATTGEKQQNRGRKPGQCKHLFHVSF